MGRIFFTGDQHFFHGNAIYYCNRPFKNLNAMHSGIIDRHNEVVGPDDVCYHLGDIAFISKSQIQKLEKIISKLNGTNILILGNHDENHPFTYMNLGFMSVHTSLILPEDNRFILNHDPAASLLYKNKFWIVAHVHDLFTVHKNCVNVGVDVRNYYPVSLEEVVKDAENNCTLRE